MNWPNFNVPEPEVTDKPPPILSPLIKFSTLVKKGKQRLQTTSRNQGVVNVIKFLVRSRGFSIVNLNYNKIVEKVMKSINVDTVGIRKPNL